jgi:hypothetical protein
VLIVSVKRSIFCVLVVAVFLACGAVSPCLAADEAEMILDGRTAFHWGADYLAWVVHYPDDVVEPWVRSQTKGAGDPTGRMAEEFRRSLRMDDSTPVLLSVHCFGGNAVNLKPLPEKLKLRKADGEVLVPKSYERVFDEPLTGLVQGLVFFPKIEGPFELLFSASGKDETVLEFPSDRETRLRREVTGTLRREMAADAAAGADEVRRRVADAESQAREKAEADVKEEMEALRQQYRELAAQRDMLRGRLDEALLELAQARKVQQDEPEAAAPKATLTVERKARAAGPTREQAAERFVVAWKLGQLDRMHELLSPAFKAEVPEPGDLKKFFSDRGLPLKLPQGARIEWEEGSDRARVIYAPKILFIRTLRSVRVTVMSAGIGWLVSGLD